ncbi:Hypothetical protein PHPALM_10114 [Phytophthora palmivora]|uniref:Uncharacterized protein n=1 Tax=Phytophthora palmivora TaxID=4796 RepID=A0A2P4Y5G5_9STRA|nr:Hypothetical protein PHPALM_10114 [Phytophthora palmivora]
MQLISTLALLAIAVQCVLASPERKLLRSGYDTPVDFSTLTGGTGTTDPTVQQHNKHGIRAVPSLPGVDSLTKGLSGVTSGDGDLSKLLPSSLPSTGVLSSITKGDGLLPTDTLSSLSKGSSGGASKLLPTNLNTLTKGAALPSLAGDGGLNSITNGLTKGDSLKSITGGLTKGNTLPSLPSLPIGSGSNGADVTKNLSGVTDKLSGFTNGIDLLATSTNSDNKPAYSAGGK